MKPGSFRVDHVAFPVFDAAATFRFYTEVMRLPLVEAFSGDDWGGRPWLLMVFAVGDGRQLALCALAGLERPPEGGLPRDLRHVAFAAASGRELAAWKARLRAARVEFWEEDHGDQRSIYFTDPNGMVLEVTTPTSESAIPANRDARETVLRWIEDQARDRRSR